MAAITRDGYVIGASPSNAEDVNYDNSTSGLEATDVQSGIDELKEIIDSNPGTTYTFANGTNGFTVTPSGGSAQTVTVTPSFSVGTGDSNGQVKINGTNASVKGLGNDAYTSTNNVVYLNNDIPEGAANLSATATAHKITTYRNGFTIPYQMDNTNDGGMLRVRGTSESNCILELATWDDSGSGETIQFNYYPTTSQVTPTYSVVVPKKSGTIALTSDVSAMQSTLQSNFQAGVDSVYNAIKAQGTTPASKSLSDVVNAIGTMSNNRYNSGYSKGVSDADGRSNPSSYNYQTGYNAGYSAGYSAGSGAAKSVPYSISLDGDSSGSHKVDITFGNTKVVDGVRVYYSDDFVRSGNITY